MRGPLLGNLSPTIDNYNKIADNVYLTLTVPSTALDILHVLAQLISSLEEEVPLPLLHR